MRGRTLRLLVLVLALVTANCGGPDLDLGLQAYNQGDYSGALKHIRPLAEQGHSVAQFNLGNMYDNGQGVPSDTGEAMKWYQRAAEQGLAEAQFNLGTKLQDDREAVRWILMAAEQRYAIAQYNLGMRYKYGRGVPQDYIQAFMWFNLADAAGLDIAAEALKTVAKQMTSTQITEARRLARVWEPKKVEPSGK